MQNEARAFHMAQEIMSEADPIGSPLDQSRNICHDEALLIVRLYNTEHWGQRCKMVVCNLGACCRTRGNEARFPDARIPDKTDISEKLEL